MRSTDRRPSRHDRVWLDPARWRSARRDRPDDQLAALVARWIERGRALVTRRRDPDTRDDECCLGIALPIAEERRRIGLVVEADAVVRVAPPLTLEAIIDAAPSQHRAVLGDLHRRAIDLDTALQVYGSFAWQAISGEPCVTPTSDLDLLWTARDATQVAAMIALLLDWERTSGLRADGEVRLANGDAIAWRELATSAARVIVKRDDAVALMPSPFHEG